MVACSRVVSDREGKGRDGKELDVTLKAKNVTQRPDNGRDGVRGNHKKA